MGRNAASILSLSVAVLLAAAAPAWAQQSPSRKQETKRYLGFLKTQSIEPTAEALRKYLQGLYPSEAQKKRVGELIRQLSSQRWTERENATKELMAMPLAPVAQLRVAAQCGDLEVETRAKAVLAKPGHQLPTILHAVLQVVRLKKLTGLAGEILGAMPLCEQDYMRAAAARALAASARKQDIDLLRTFLKSKDTRVGLLAAIQLAEFGDRQSMAALHRLMADANPAIRDEAHFALATLTGNYKLPFHAYAPAKKRAKQRDAWKAWLADNGEKVTLRIPLREHVQQRSYLRGRTLVAYGHHNKVEELDGQGKVIWSYSDQIVFHAEKLRNGNVLICVPGRTGKGEVLEISREGKTVWKYDAFAMDARQLPNGNILIADFTGARVIEVTRNRRIVWEQKLGGSARGAQRLPNGNTLTACDAGTAEFSPDGERVWEYPGPSYSAQRLVNGNTLITQYNKDRIIEVTPGKTIVWEFEEKLPCDAYRLPNGNTLIANFRRAIEVTPAKKIIWQRGGLKYGNVRRWPVGMLCGQLLCTQ